MVDVVVVVLVVSVVVVVVGLKINPRGRPIARAHKRRIRLINPIVTIRI